MNGYMIQFEENEPLRVNDLPVPRVSDCLEVRLVRPKDRLKGTLGTRVLYKVTAVIGNVVKAKEIEDPVGEIQKRYLVNSSSEGNRCKMDEIHYK